MLSILTATAAAALIWTKAVPAAVGPNTEAGTPPSCCRNRYLRAQNQQTAPATWRIIAAAAATARKSLKQQ